MIAEEHNLRVILALEIRDGNSFDKQLIALKKTIAPLNSTQKVALYKLGGWKANLRNANRLIYRKG